MDKKTIGTGLTVAGTVLLLVSVTADMTGLGAYPGFGWKQWIGAAIGLLDVAGGLFLHTRAS